MANQPENPVWEAGIYQFETTDYVEGGLGGIDNLPLLQLANRTAYLKQETDNLSDAVTALQISNPQGVRNTVLSGEITITETYLERVSATVMRVKAASIPLVFTTSKGFDAKGEVVYNVELAADRDNTDSGPTSGTRYGFLRYDPALGTVTFEIADRLVVSSDVPTGTDRILWYNPIAATFDYNDGSFWAVNICACPIGEWTVTGGSINAGSVITYPMRSQLYDERTNPGTIKTFASTKTPRGGWLFCNGAQVSRTQYARLFAEIGTTWGAGNGTTTFNLPDLRGRFLRMWAADGSLDAGRVLGSTQTDEFEAHGHPIAVVTYNLAAGADYNLTIPEAGGGGALGTGSVGSTETRPANSAVAAWIKF